MQRTANDILSGIRIKAEYVEQQEEVINGRRYFSDKWKVVLKYNGRQFTTPFIQGSGWNGEEPNLKNVLHSLLSDYHAYKDSDGVESFGREFGYETDEREGREKLQKTYSMMARHALKLERFFETEEIEKLSEFFQDY